MEKREIYFLGYFVGKFILWENPISFNRLSLSTKLAPNSQLYRSQNSGRNSGSLSAFAEDHGLCPWMNAYLVDN